MVSLSNFLRVFLSALIAPSPAPCCAATVHWASFR
jgi:hypothetical protein